MIRSESPRSEASATTGSEQSSSKESPQRRILKHHLGPYLAAFGLGAAAYTGIKAAGVSSDDLVAHALVADTSDEGFADNQIMIDRLANQTVGLGEDLLRQRVRAFQMKYGEKYPEPKIVGFERLGFSQEFLRQYLAVLPTTWTSGATIGSIIFEPQDIPLPYPGHEDGKEFAHCDRIDLAPGKIVITSPNLLSDDSYQRSVWRRYLLQEALIHEVVHAIDWKSFPFWSSQQSLQLRDFVFQAVTAPGHPEWWYVEKIKPSFDADAPKKEQTTNRMKEYIAMLMSYSLTSRFDTRAEPSWQTWQAAFAKVLETQFSATPAEAVRNAQFVAWCFIQSDPAFQPWIAAQQLRDFRMLDRRTQTLQMVMPLIEKRLDSKLRQQLTAKLRGTYAFRSLEKRQDEIAVSLLEPEATVFAQWRVFLQETLNVMAPFVDDDDFYDPMSMVRQLENFLTVWDDLEDMERSELRPLLQGETEKIYADLKPF